jgi:glycosyltransferase involved in cell wall biosynthesis
MITVMFSTCNGGPDLKRMLDSLAQVISPPDGWELIAVDNASTDGSIELMRSYEGRIPVKVIQEPKPGKNRALNSALKEAKGDFFVFTDDDIIVRPDWLVKWHEVAKDQPGFSLFAGNTRPLWSLQPPAWMLRGVDVAVLYASHEGMQEGPCTAACMYGTNMATRAAVFADGLRFNDNIGPDGTANYAMGSDTEIAIRLEEAGHKCWFASAPVVEHIVPPSHLEPTWILKRGYRWGRGLARMKLPYPCTVDQLERKNNIKRFAYPFMLYFLPRSSRWQRQWWHRVDQGYEDGARENNGLKPRWAASS